MKRPRRIEITAFRRRTTVILRDKLEGRPIKPLRHDEAREKPVAGAVAGLTPISNAKIKDRRDDHENKDNNS